MVASSRTRQSIMTYDDYLRLPDDGKQYEIIGGEISVTPAPGISHQQVSRNLAFILHGHVKARKLGEVYNAPTDVVLSRIDVVQPDILFVAERRRGMITTRAVEGPPDLVVEILSPSSVERDEVVKTQLYALHGVAHYWIIDPAAQTLSEHVRADPSGEPKLVLRGKHSGTARFVPAIFPELTIDLGEVFG